MWVCGCPGGRRASGRFSAVICITEFLKTKTNPICLFYYYQFKRF